MEGDLDGFWQFAWPGGDAKSVDDEVHDFPGAVGERIDRGIGAFFELQRIAVETHGCAGAAGDDDRKIASEHFRGVQSDLARCIPIARVEGGLAAAGLVFGENDFHAEMF